LVFHGPGAHVVVIGHWHGRTTFDPMQLGKALEGARLAASRRRRRHAAFAHTEANLLQRGQEAVEHPVELTCADASLHN